MRKRSKRIFWWLINNISHSGQFYGVRVFKMMAAAHISLPSSKKSCSSELCGDLGWKILISSSFTHYPRGSVRWQTQFWAVITSGTWGFFEAECSKTLKMEKQEVEGLEMIHVVAGEAARGWNNSIMEQLWHLMLPAFLQPCSGTQQTQQSWRVPCGQSLGTGLDTIIPWWCISAGFSSFKMSPIWIFEPFFFLSFLFFFLPVWRNLISL